MTSSPAPNQSTQKDYILMMARVASLLSLALMVGGIFSVGSLVAPLVFMHLPDVEAGALMGHVFKRFDAVLVTSTVLLLLAELLIYWRDGRHRVKRQPSHQRLIQVKGFLLTALLVSLSYGVFVVHPNLNALKAKVKPVPVEQVSKVPSPSSVDSTVQVATDMSQPSVNGVATLSSEDQTTFDDLHHRAEMLYKLDWLLAVGLVVLAAL